MYFLGSFEAAAKAMKVESITARVHSDADIDVAIAALGGGDAGLVMMSDSFMGVHRGTVISAALRHKVPTIFDAAGFAREGGLLAYGSSNADSFRRSAGYVDRILRGARPADLPVQAPALFEMCSISTPRRHSGLRYRCSFNSAPMKWSNNGFILVAVHESGIVHCAGFRMPAMTI